MRTKELMLYKHMEDGQILTDMTCLMENYDNDYYNTCGSARGAGKAGGWGYHRASAALESAFSRAGMRFEDGCSCKGEGAMRDCLMCAGEYLKPAGAKIYIVECYG